MKLNPYHPLAQGLEITYMMNEYGGDIVYDVTGHQHNGSGTNLIWGRDGLDLPGANEHITIPNPLGQDDDWTLFMSFVQDTRNPDTQSIESTLVSMKDGTGTGRMWLYIDDMGAPATNKLESFIDGSANTANTVININTQYTAGLTKNGTSFHFYLNGADDGNFVATADAANGDMVLFDHKGVIGNGCFDGTVKVFHLYNRQLSADEMRWLDLDSFCMYDPDYTSHPYVTTDVELIMSPGIFPNTAFPDRCWVDDVWADYGSGEPPATLPPGWSKYKKITLTGGSSGAQTDYQLKLDITYDSDMKSDFSDLRFTKADGTTLIDAWLESKVDSTSAVVWVEFPTTPANGSTEDYYMYYGNSGASSNWSGINTFDKYADKDDYSTYFNSNGVSGVGDYIRVGIANTDSWGTNYLTAKTALDRTVKGYAAVFKLKGIGTSSNEDETMFGFATNNDLTIPQCDFYYKAGTTLNVYENHSSINIDTITWTNENKYEMLYPVNTGVKYYVNDVLKRNNTSYASDPGKVRITPYSGPIDVKYIYARKYVDNPSTYEFGSEESSGHPVMRRFGGIPGMRYLGRNSW